MTFQGCFLPSFNSFHQAVSEKNYFLKSINQKQELPVIWPCGFRGEDFFKSANQNQELPMVAMFVNGSGQNEQSLERTFHRCFLPSFTSFGWGISEEKIKMWKVNGRQTTSDGKSSHCLWQGELKMYYMHKFVGTIACFMSHQICKMHFYWMLSSSVIRFTKLKRHDLSDLSNILHYMYF